MVGLRELKLPSSLESLGEDACAMLCVARLDIPGGVRKIPRGAFSYNHSLKSLRLNPGLLEIGEKAFFVCDELCEVTMPQSVEKIGDFAFAACRKLRKLTLNCGLLEIGSEAFAECDALLEIDIPDTVKYIGRCAFPDSKRLTLVVADPKNIPNLWNIGTNIKLKKRK